MAEEDLIFGKNRHMFGGIEPSNMIEFNAISAYDPKLNKIRIRLKYKLPVDTVIEGQQLCSVAGAIIKRKEGSYPKDEFDGITIVDVHENGEYLDTSVTENNKYYYAAFPYTSQGVYNRSMENRSECKAIKYIYYYGFDLDTKNPNPNTRVVYPKDVMNYNYAPAYMNFSTKKFNYGSWPSEAGKHFMPKPCMLDTNGKVVEYLNPNDYKKTINGSPSKVTDINSNLNAMVEWPKIYTHREEVNGIYKFRCSDSKLGDDWDCWCNYDKDDNEVDHFYMSIYPLTLYNDRGRSISAKDLWHDASSEQMKRVAANNGSRWTASVIADRLLIQDLLVMISKSTNSQSKFGLGKQNTIPQSGGDDTTGMFYGDSNGNNILKVFGIENYWGSQWVVTLGLLLHNGSYLYKITRGKRDGSASNDYHEKGIGYVDSKIKVEGPDIAGFTNRMIVLPFGRLPVGNKGSDSTYECDVFQTDTSLEFTICGAGGSYGAKTQGGLFGYDLYESYNHTHLGNNSGLSFK